MSLDLGYGKLTFEHLVHYGVTVKDQVDPEFIKDRSCFLVLSISQFPIANTILFCAVLLF